MTMQHRLNFYTDVISLSLFASGSFQSAKAAWPLTSLTTQRQRQMAVMNYRGSHDFRSTETKVEWAGEGMSETWQEQWHECHQEPEGHKLKAKFYYILCCSHVNYFKISDIMLYKCMQPFFQQLQRLIWTLVLLSSKNKQCRIIVTLTNYLCSLAILFCSSFTFPVWVYWRQTVKLESAHWSRSPDKNKSDALHFIFLGIKSESHACLESSCHSSACTHTCIKTQCDIEGTSSFGVRPGRRAHKAMGTAGHRREDERSSAEMWSTEGWNWS